MSRDVVAHNLLRVNNKEGIQLPKGHSLTCLVSHLHSNLFKQFSLYEKKQADHCYR